MNKICMGIWGNTNLRYRFSYDGWFGLDLFPYRDDPKKFIELSRDNLRLAPKVVKLMRKSGADEMRKDCTKGPEMAELIRDCIRKA